MPLGNTGEGFATIPVTLHWQESDKLNRSQAAIFDAVLNHDKSSHIAIRVDAPVQTVVRKLN